MGVRASTEMPGGGEMKEREVEGGSLIIRLDGTFDELAAKVVLKALQGAAEGTEVYVDLARVREFHDAAVGMFAEALMRTKHQVSVRGLRQHQYRMLRYLGVRPSALDPGLAPRPRPTLAPDAA
jgi:anti-anti-sigma regulatory factor